MRSGSVASASRSRTRGWRTATGPMPGHHLAFRQVTVAHDALVAIRGLQIGMLAEKVCDFGLDRLGEKGTCPVAQDFCELIVEDSWLNQLDDVIVGHGISLLRWRSGGVKHPHDMPPFRFPPSPTFSDSSRLQPTSHISPDTHQIPGLSLIVSLADGEPTFITRRMDGPAAIHQTFIDRGNVTGYPEALIRQS
ncbi:hypothetical protein ACVW0J_009314 [Bradyrhizobium sp. i1.7.7]